MKRGEEFSIEKNVESGLADVNHLIKVLGKQIELLDAAYRKRNHMEFNLLKKQVLELQRRIRSLIN